MAEFGWDISPGRRSSGAPLVPMVQSADLWQLEHLTGFWGVTERGSGASFPRDRWVRERW